MPIGRATYTTLLTLVTPLLLLRQWVRSRRQSGGVRLGEVMGSAPPPPRTDIWIHAVSVGEVLAAEPLIRRLRGAGAKQIIVTTTTPTGAAMVIERLGDHVTHRFTPLDLPRLQRRFLKAVQPRCIVVMETEIWPNMLTAAESVGIPVILANARLSERSRRRYARIPRLIRPALNRFHWIACRNTLDRDRFIALGADAERVTANGDIKFDIAVSPDDQTAVESLKPSVQGRPVVILASTHNGEESLLIERLEILRQALPELLIIVAPRHPQRFNAVADLLSQQGVSFVRRSEGLPAPSTAYWLLDTLGELKRFYGLADVAFMGGSLVPVGGHNPLEAVLWHCPVVTGLHVDNFEALFSNMETAGILKRTADTDEVVGVIREWLTGGSSHRKDLESKASAFIAENQGATDRLVRALQEATGDR